MNQTLQPIPYQYDRMNWVLAQVATMPEGKFWWGIITDCEVIGSLLTFAILQAEAYVVENGGWLAHPTE
jgi:hypothetical protein